MWKRSTLLFILITTLTIALGIVADRVVPEQHLPWRSLNPEAPLGAATKTQFMRLALSPSKTCMDMAEATTNLNSLPSEPHKPNKTCGWKIARTVSGSSAASLSPIDVDMQCPLAIGAYIWMREVDDLAQKHLGSDISKIHHVGTYSCRRQNGNNSGEWSEHAFANAWDITGFELKDGRIISIQKDWKGDNRARTKFLKQARNKACKIFRVTLSPDFNAAHHDHFHLDMGPNRSCR